VKYFPVDDNDNIDIEVTGDWGARLDSTRAKVNRITDETVEVLEKSSRFRVYKNPDSQPSLDYKILKTYEFLEPLPTF
ncbi:MAG: hypothetical protein GWN14_20020, partial [candidate division Zixibacteria bacterium]|nr:hypothetical protein [Gammaproteobacteria bacterium]NIX58137.1 hypothetical protein [candidate division Zixibacteria bacterium]